VLTLVPHRLDGDVVVDEGMALGIAGDTDPLERAAQLAQGAQHRQRALVGAGGRIGVPRRDEDVVDAGLSEPVGDLFQMDLVAQQPRGHVRDHPVAVRREPLGQGEGRFQALDRRRRHGDDDVARHMGEDLVLGRPGGQHLVADAVQQRP
jgi:hypothetical protein